MKKIFLLIAVTTLLTACRDGIPRDKIFNSALCGDVSGFTLSYFAYGEGKMLMVPLSKVRKETVFVVGLRPLDGFGDAEVTVTGTTANAGWMPGITEQHDNLPGGTYPRGVFEVGCVPADPVGTSYKFEVKVVKGSITNTLDPRIEVVP